MINEQQPPHGAGETCQVFFSVAGVSQPSPRFVIQQSQTARPRLSTAWAGEYAGSCDVLLAAFERTRGIPVHDMAEFLEIPDFSPAPKLDVDRQDSEELMAANNGSNVFRSQLR
jgi:hypothetical protein